MAVISGTAGDDELTGTDTEDTMFGLGADDHLYANGGDDFLYGMSGNDWLDGGPGVDNMIGGSTSDTYIVDNHYDFALEGANEGAHDLIITTVSYTLPDNVENLTLFNGINNEVGGINGAGNDLDNIIHGNSKKNVLSGYDGADTLDGELGADVMLGGDGSDTYYVDNAGDVASESPNKGLSDAVHVEISYTLPANIENLYLEQYAGAINGTGNELDNALYGNESHNSLSGAGGADSLDGKDGADTMIGGSGNDAYHVDNTGDKITEFSREGTEWVHSRVDYTLPAHVENMMLWAGSGAINGAGNDLDNNIWGNPSDNGLKGAGGADHLYGLGGDDAILGGEGTDTLDGGIGADAMAGGFGNDTYVIDNAGDAVTETPNQGIDTIDSAISYTLKANAENLTLTGLAAKGTGNTLANVIFGNGAANTILAGAGDDTIDGGGGNDTITGGLGQDIMNGGGGDDTFDFNDVTQSGTGTTRDIIADFVQGDDLIDLSTIDASTSAAGNQAFTFIGTAAFTAEGQVRAVESGGNTIVAMNVSDISAGDSQIELTGVFTLTALDFSL